MTPELDALVKRLKGYLDITEPMVSPGRTFAIPIDRADVVTTAAAIEELAGENEAMKALCGPIQRGWEAEVNKLQTDLAACKQENERLKRTPYLAETYDQLRADLAAAKELVREAFGIIERIPFDYLQETPNKARFAWLTRARALLGEGK